MKNLASIFNIKKGDIVSIVGSGGKTTLLFQLASELKDNYCILVSTSTKIYKPSDEYDVYTTINDYVNNFNKKNKSITVIARDINIENNKLIGISNEDLDILKNSFDIILLEADGSKGLPLKGWKEHEPVILKKSNKTIGIIPANLINKKIEKNLVYGFDEFNMLIDNSQYFDFEAIRKICINNNGLFKNSEGSLYLFLNKADTEEDIKNTKELSAYLKKYNHNFNISCGSLKKGEYYEC